METKFPIVWIHCILNTKCVIKLLQVRKILTGNYTQYFVITYMRNLKDNIYIYICVLFTQSCLTLCNPTDYSLPGFSVYGTLQARILEWIAILFSRGTSQPRDWTLVSCITGRFFTFKFFCPFTFTLKWLTHHRITILVCSKFDCILYQYVVQFCIISCY